jgi:hypothetical protein
MPVPALVALAALSATPAAAASCPGQVAFLHHVMAVVDRETADAVAASAALRRYASLDLRTTRTPGKPDWVGRYVNLAHTYLELFGPGDSGDDSPAGSLGLAIGGDAAGVTDAIDGRLRGAGFDPDRRMTQRAFGGRTIDWFASLRIKQPAVEAGAPAIKTWTVEFQPDFFAAPEAARAPSLGAQDTVSRRRYLANAYTNAPLADISAVEIAVSAQSYRHDIRPLLVAAGFCLKETGRGAQAWGGEAAIRVRFVAAAAARLEAVRFTLAAPARSRTTLKLGKSALRIGPGRTARWTFERP